MNDSKTRELLDKLENMEKIPQQFMHELQIAVQRADGLKTYNEILISKNEALHLAFEKLMETHQELRQKMGFDNTSNQMTYDIFNESGVLDFKE